jgi:thiol-disulfide isomerase/thioredoxin
VFVENPSYLDVQIPESKNITYNNQNPIPMTTAQIANEFERYDNKPVLLYVYTTWCSVCLKQFPTINEIAREFQNTDLQVLTLATDRDLDPKHLQEHLNKFGNLYFSPHYLSYKEGFLDFLKKKNIKYQGRIPFTVLISRQGEVVAKFVGVKNKNYLRNKIIKEL